MATHNKADRTDPVDARQDVDSQRPVDNRLVTERSQFNLPLPQSTANTGRRRKGVLLLVSIGLLTLGMLACSLLTVPPLVTWIGGATEVTAPLTTAEHFYTSMIKHQYLGAYADLAPELASKYSRRDLESNWNALEGQGEDIALGHVSAYIKPNAKSEAEALVKFTKAGARQQYQVLLQLRRIGDVWRISSAQPDLIPGK